jgi:hypothetical protein
MIEHGNLEAAMELAMRYDTASAFPFSVAIMLMERLSEQERLALLRRAVEDFGTMGPVSKRFRGRNRLNS